MTGISKAIQHTFAGIGALALMVPGLACAGAGPVPSQVNATPPINLNKVGRSHAGKPSQEKALAAAKKSAIPLAQDAGKGGFKNMRDSAISSAASTLAAQKGLVWRTRVINRTLKQIASTLDSAYSFTPLMIQGRVQPPVITQVRGSFRVKNNRTAVSSATTWRIIKPAKIVTQPPNWRQYLFRHFKTTDNVNKALLPKNAHERKVWARAVARGWKSGVEQANRIFKRDLARLNRDYKGMARFHVLANENIVKVPYMATGKLGIVVNGKRLSVKQRIFRITQASHFNNHARQWHAQPAPAYASNPGSGTASANAH